MDAGSLLSIIFAGQLSGPFHGDIIDNPSEGEQSHENSLQCAIIGQKTEAALKELKRNGQRP